MKATHGATLDQWRHLASLGPLGPLGTARTHLPNWQNLGSLLSILLLRMYQKQSLIIYPQPSTNITTDAPKMAALHSPTSSAPTQTTTTQIQTSTPVLRLRASAAPPRQRIHWAEDVIDNEGAGRKKSKGTSQCALCFPPPPNTPPSILHPTSPPPNPSPLSRPVS